MKLIRPALKGSLCVMLAALLYASSDVFLMVSGSDATSSVVAPPAAVQSAGLAVFVLCLFIPATRPARAGLVILAAAAALVSGHRLVADGLRGEVRDVYLLTTLQRLPLDQALEGGLSTRPAALGFQIGPAASDEAIRVFSPPVIGLDRQVLERLAS